MSGGGKGRVPVISGGKLDAGRFRTLGDGAQKTVAAGKGVPTAAKRMINSIRKAQGRTAI